MTKKEAEPATAEPATASPIPIDARAEQPHELPNALPDRAGDVTVALSPRDLAFLALIAGLILALLRRVFGRRRGRGSAADVEG